MRKISFSLAKFFFFPVVIIIYRPSKIPVFLHTISDPRVSSWLWTSDCSFWKVKLRQTWWSLHKKRHFKHSVNCAVWFLRQLKVFLQFRPSLFPCPTTQKKTTCGEKKERDAAFSYRLVRNAAHVPANVCTLSRRTLPCCPLFTASLTLTP